MSRDDLLWVGCKLLGIFFAVWATISFLLYGCYVIEQFAADTMDPYPITSQALPINLRGITTVLGYVLVAYLLTHQTEWCIWLFTKYRGERHAEQASDPP